MKRLIIAALLLLPLLFASECHAAAPTIANAGGQHCAVVVVFTTSVNCSLPNNVTAGNMIVIFVAGCSTTQGGGTTLNPPTMTGETFTKITGASKDGTTGGVATYTTNSAVGGQKQVTFTTSGGTCDPHLHVMEITGQAGSPIDATGNTESTTMSVSTSGSTTNATDLVLAFFFDNVNGPTLSCTAPYAAIDSSNGGPTTSVGINCQNTTSSTGTQTATGSGNGTDTAQQAIIAIAPPSGVTATGTNILGQSKIVGGTKVM